MTRASYHTISNFSFDVTSGNREDLADLLRSVERQNPGARFYKLTKRDGRQTLTLFWGNDGENCTELPYELTGSKLHHFVDDWLSSLEEKDLDPRPDIDGSVEMGEAFRMFWSCRSFYEVISVQPVWAEYHK